MPDATPAAARYAAVVKAFRRRRGVTVGAAKRGFGSSALCTGGRIFAMLSSHGAFVVKLPRARVDALVAAGTGTRFTPAAGRVMREWLAVDPAADADWTRLAAEAREFVGDAR